MSIESDCAPSAQACPKTTGTRRPMNYGKPPMHTPSNSQVAAPSVDDIAHLGDVLLGDDLTLMGGAIESSWASTNTSHASTNAASTGFQASSSAFACPPASLTRHVSLPVSMMRSQDPNPFGMMPVSNASYNSTNMMASQPPMLVRQRSMGYPMHHVPVQSNFHYPVPRNAGSAMYLSVAHQSPLDSPTHVPMSNKPSSFNSSNADAIEPIAFNPRDSSKMSNDRLDLDAEAFSLFGEALTVISSEVGSSSTTSTSACSTTTATGNSSHGTGNGSGDLETAFDSLDKLLPEMDQELFQPSELNSLAAANASNHDVSAMTPRDSFFSNARGSLPIIMSPNVKTISPSPAAAAAMMAAFSAPSAIAMSPMGAASTGGTPRSKTAATCKVAGCERRVRSKGFCKTHGGGRKCSIPGCKKSSQNGEFCIGHGGGKKCKEEGCAKAAQSHGLCKAHGGGARCKFPNCTKSSQGGGLCRAHGGGKRCQAPGCPKGAQRGNFCATHGGFRNCKIEGCVRTDRGGGYCEVHRRGRLCKIDGCKKLARNQGMCTMHIREEKQELTMDRSQRAASSAATPRSVASPTVLEDVPLIPTA